MVADIQLLFDLHDDLKRHHIKAEVRYNKCVVTRNYRQTVYFRSKEDMNLYKIVGKHKADFRLVTPLEQWFYRGTSKIHARLLNLRKVLLKFNVLKV